ISNVGSGFTSGAPEVPDGQQVAFLQSNGYIRQTVFLQPGAILTFNATQRVNSGNQQTLQVLVNGVVQTFNQGSPSGRTSASTVTPPSTYYESYAVNLASVVTSGNYTVQIAGTITTGDATAFVDTVAITLPATRAYGLWDPAFTQATWRSDQPSASNSVAIGL